MWLWLTMNIRSVLWGAALIVTLAGATWAYKWAYNRGYSACEARLEAETLKRQKRIDNLTLALNLSEKRLSEARSARTDLERALEDESAKDPNRNNSGLGAGSLHRLNQIR